jgi:hypothetical protein
MLIKFLSSELCSYGSLSRLKMMKLYFLQHSSGRASFHIRKRSAVCVRRFDGSQCAARHTTFRALLRSSSIQEPRYPPLGDYLLPNSFLPKLFILLYIYIKKKCLKQASYIYTNFKVHCSTSSSLYHMSFLNNDPSAGSPTETLLRLLLPLDDKVH